MSIQEKVLEQIEEITKRFEMLERKMADPEVIADADGYRKLTMQHAEYEPIVEAYRQYQETSEELAEYEAIIANKNEDPELVEMAREGAPGAREKMDDLFMQLQRHLLPKDPMDGSNVILELRAGTGGEEAGLFCAEMFRAYQRYAERKRWRVNITSSNETGIGGLKEVTAVVEGKDVWSHLKYESGVHRVQRVPQTESQGRVHTSAISVAVLPEVEDVEVEINDKDLRIDTFRSSGAGGQHVNTTDSAIRITHMPSGIVVSCQDERSQGQNKLKAMRILRSHLYDKMMREQHDKIAADRKSMVGSGDRSEKIRTCNFPQGRITDHRIKVTLYKLDGYMGGDMEEMIENCRAQFEAQRIQDQFADQND